MYFYSNVETDLTLFLDINLVAEIPSFCRKLDRYNTSRKEVLEH